MIVLTNGPCNGELSVRPRRSRLGMVNTVVGAGWGGWPLSSPVAAAALPVRQGSPAVPVLPSSRGCPPWSCAFPLPGAGYWCPARSPLLFSALGVGRACFSRELSLLFRCRLLGQCSCLRLMDASFWSWSNETTKPDDFFFFSNLLLSFPLVEARGFHFAQPVFFIIGQTTLL